MGAEWVGDDHVAVRGLAGASTDRMSATSSAGGRVPRWRGESRGRSARCPRHDLGLAAVERVVCVR